MTFCADAADIDAFHAAGWWDDVTISARVAQLAASRPGDAAYLSVAAGATAATVTTWARYDELADAVAGAISGAGLAPGDRIAVVIPDGPEVHAALVGAERAGVVAVGIGARAGDRELRHLVSLTGARALCTLDAVRGRPATELRDALAGAGAAIDRHVVISPDGVTVDGVRGVAAPFAGRALGPDELFLLNSTSGTTGLPKCVMHTQNRWKYFHQLAAAAGEFGDDEALFGAVPAPFGFGLWTAHFTPALLGAPTVVMERFDADTALDLIAAHRVTVLCCVTTQFIMMLNAQAARPRDLSSLRSMFTGGENVPDERAAEFEQTTGARVLQFYGSNETGALSCTTTVDTRERRLSTAGRVIDEMHVRLFDPATGVDITGSSEPGQPGCKGPATCLGYWGDEEANAKLYTPDGWMLMGDIVTIDPEGYLRVVGRVSDFIIRGGKNISAPAVEDEVGTHPDVTMVAAVPMPDPVFGERVCIYVVAREGATVTLERIVEHLTARGVSKEWFPEYLVVVDDLPRSSGGKVAKGELTDDARRRVR